MIDQSTLEQAVTKGILDNKQRDALLALEQERQSAVQSKPDPADFIGDDQIRLIGGGNDIFVTVGVALLFAGGLFTLHAVFPLRNNMTAIILVIASWLVAEIVTRQKRMRLSSTLLSLVFSASVLALLIQVLLDQVPLPEQINPFALLALRSEVWRVVLIIGGGMSVATILYFYRFKVPILAGVLAILITGLFFLWAVVFYYDQLSGGAVAVPQLNQLADVVADALAFPLFCGMVVFAIAVMLDLHDRNRQTIWSDCAFWLHVVSAPLLVHPLFILATGQEVLSGRIEPGTGASILLGLMMVSFVFIALCIDRRSLLAPTLAYFGSVGIYYLINDAANTAGIPPFALILIAVGAVVILFGAGWQRIRRLIIAPLLPTSVLDRLPPIKA